MQHPAPRSCCRPLPIVVAVLAALGTAWPLPAAWSATAAAPATPATTAAEDPDARAARIEAQLSDDERVRLLMGIITVPGASKKLPLPAGVPSVAGYVPGVPRLGIPPQLATDASLGVTNPSDGRPGDKATALPSGLAMAASFDPVLAEKLGALVGLETRSRGFNILLGGGMNLARDPRNGRNFEYLGEDPLLAGVLSGHAIRGSQSQGVVSTIKHFALNAQETQRMTLDARIDTNALRESELLAFQIGIEIGQPGAVMCAYNLVNGQPACGHDGLLNGVLKGDWGYKGWVMSDWGAVGSTDHLLAGLDQQAGSQWDREFWFGQPLRERLAAGTVPRERVSDAVRRILRSLYAVGADQIPAPLPTVDLQAHAQQALDAARAGIVLLKNDGVLPLAAGKQRILVVGGHADFGVMSGGGSSQVTPSNGAPRTLEVGGDGGLAIYARQSVLPGAPLAALRQNLPAASISFHNAYSADAAVAQAAHADLVIVFATKWEGEGVDSGSLALPQGQDELIAQLARTNRNLVVVLETGNPVTMPWLAQARAVVQAWYPGQGGGQAIADVLSGVTNPSGRLPISFPQSLQQTPREALIPGLGLPYRTPATVHYSEGAEAGYRWHARTGQAPLFAFGHGLSYTRFSHGTPRIQRGADQALSLSVDVRNTGAREGSDVPQAYLVARNGQPLQRLVGFQKLTLRPGDSAGATLRVDPRLLADFRDGGWQMPAGRYEFAIGHSAGELGPRVSIELPTRRWRP